jgi:hypothetical protein
VVCWSDGSLGSMTFVSSRAPGVLTVTLPVAARAKPRRIEITPIHPPIRQNALGRIPLVLRQTTARRRHRLRRRLPPCQPLGHRPVPPRHRPRPRSPPRRTHPRPRLALHHPALLARPHRLRPNPTQRPPTPAQPTNSRGLTQGYSGGVGAAGIVVVGFSVSL